jgi:3-oxoacyl-[acyl-carrier protein] reductase
VELSGTTAVVTGASRGIGAAIARALSTSGCTVILVARGREDLDRVAGGCDGPTECLSTDLETEDATRTVADFVTARHDRLDILVNNAGIATPGAFEETDRDTFRRHMTLNAETPYFLTQALLPLLRRADEATVVNIASVVSHKGYPNQSAYSASKHALLGWTKAAARELQEEKIRFHVVSPGGVGTSMVREVRPDLDPAALIEPADVARAVLYLLSMPSGVSVDEIRMRRAASDPFV